jgi:hypothetical protein
MARTTIDRLIINSPYEEPQRHWRYDRETRLFDLVEGRRPAGYVVAGSGDAIRKPLTIRASSSRSRWSTRSARASRPGARRGIRASPASPSGCWRSLARPGGVRHAALLLLPVGGGGDADLAHRSARGRACGHRDSRRWRGVLADGAARWPPVRAKPLSWR